MSCQCREPTFAESDDDHLILDDTTTDTKTCKKCGKRCEVVFSGQWITDMNNLTGLTDDYFDHVEDSPLLINDRVLSFGQLSISNFHCHTIHRQNDNVRAYKTLCTVSILCLFFMVTELIGGYIAGSLAVMTDAAHLFSDLIGFLVSIISIWIGKRPATRYMTFGYHRAEVLGAFMSVLVVWILSGIFFILAIDRLIKNEDTIDADTMLIIAGLGLVINIIMGAVLHGFCFKTHGHSHGLNDHHSHTHSENLNIRAAAAHIIGDVLQSVGVLVAAIIIKFFPEAHIADPICTILFSVIVVAATLKVAKDSILLLIEASPSNSAELANDLLKIRGVRHVHSLHVWSLAPGKEAVASHLAVDDNCDRDIVLSRATQIVKGKYNIVSCTLQLEAYDHEQINACAECQLLQQR